MDRHTIKRFAQSLWGSDSLYRYDINCKKETVGAAGADWTICLDFTGGTVLSFGIGEDISFDQDLIRWFGCTVHAFDPCQRAVTWAKFHNKFDNFIIHEYGLGQRDEVIRLHPPKNQAHISHSVIAHENASEETIELPVRSMETILKEIGNPPIALLKADIEGMEYEVIDSLLAANPHQLLLEFHHRFAGIGIEKTKAAIEKIRANGYALFDVSSNGENFSFLNVNPVITTLQPSHADRIAL